MTAGEIHQLIDIVLPADDAAERCLAGCAVVAREAAEAILSTVEPEDFRDPRCARVVVAAAALHRGRTGTDLDADLGAIAATAHVDAPVLHSWVDRRWVYSDANGAVARRVVFAAERRRMVLAHMEALEVLGAINLVQAAA